MKTTIECLEYQKKLIETLAKREGISIPKLLEKLIWHGWGGLGYDVSEIERR